MDNSNTEFSSQFTKNKKLGLSWGLFFAFLNLVFGIVLIFLLLFWCGWYLVVENPLTPFLCKNVNEPCNSDNPGPTVPTSEIDVDTSS